jgi:hypothetical protein
MENVKMDFNITDLLILFDELDNLTNEELGEFWFRSYAVKEFIVTLIIYKHDLNTSVIVKTIDNFEVASVDLINCNKIRVLDFDRKCLEILHNSETGRCFISLLEGPIMSYDDNYHRPI